MPYNKNAPFTQSKRPLIMGILNYTPDSFSDGGEYNTPEKALKRALEMENEGADILDLGANSTRPGAEILSPEEELARLKPALKVLSGKINIPLSVDTFYPLCAEFALNNGASIINDVSGTFNKEIALMVKEKNGVYIVTHNPCGASEIKKYERGVISHIKDFFDLCIKEAAISGLKAENLWLDPGFGFGKSKEDNFEILKNFKELKAYDNFILAGISRKRMTAFGDKTDIAHRDFITSLMNFKCISEGADVIRVHNVPMGVSTLSLANSL